MLTRSRPKQPPPGGPDSQRPASTNPMKRIRHISPKVQVQIVLDYRAKRPNGDYSYTLAEIAAKHEVSLSTVNSLARIARCQGRPHGGRKLVVPDARTMKILRDMTEPGATCEEVGRRNPRRIVVNGKTVMKPLTRQRIKQIVDFWKARSIKVRSRGFSPGDVIQWNGRLFTVLRYDSTHRGAVRDHEDKRVIDPFYWVRGAQRSHLVTPVDKA